MTMKAVAFLCASHYLKEIKNIVMKIIFKQKSKNQNARHKLVFAEFQ